MFYTYILKSNISDTLYVGSTNNVERRLSEHNSGKVYYTKRYLPWSVVYYEAYKTIDLARERERQLKKFGSAYVALKKRIGV